MRALKLSLPLILIVSALLLSAASPNPTPQSSRVGARKQTEQAEKYQGRAAKKTAIAPTLAPSPTQPAPESRIKFDNPSYEDQWFPPGTFWPPIWSNFRLAAVGTGAIIAAVCTLKGIYKQARATVVSVQVSRNAVRVANQELVIANRAYLYLSEVIISFSESRTSPGEEPRYGYVITYPIYNGGQTPALFIGAYPRVIIDSKPPEGVSKAALVLDKPQSAVVPPRGAEPLKPHYYCDVSQTELLDIRSGKYKLFFYGVLTYYDVFGKEERHTWFTLSFTGTSADAGKPNPMSFETIDGRNRFD
jgi:hypothetical protein